MQKGLRIDKYMELKRVLHLRRYWGFDYLDSRRGVVVSIVTQEVGLRVYNLRRKKKVILLKRKKRLICITTTNASALLAFFRRTGSEKFKSVKWTFYILLAYPDDVWKERFDKVGLGKRWCGRGIRAHLTAFRRRLGRSITRFSGESGSAFFIFYFIEVCKGGKPQIHILIN